jgi:multisubunit Na+/H+ antiporter MnhF subunit
MSAIFNYVLYISLFTHIVLITIVSWRVWRGENVIDRLMGVELMGTLTLAVLVLTAVIQGRSVYIDVALGLAALSFIGTIALARYVVEEEMY